MHFRMNTSDFPTIAQASSFSGLILSMLSVNEGDISAHWRTKTGSWRIYIAANILQTRPAPGQFWTFEGTSTHDPTYGEQWQVTGGRRCMPTGEQTIPYLCYHVAGLVEHRARRWLKQWPENLQDALNDRSLPDLSSALDCPIAPYLARQAVDLWLAHSRQLELAIEIGELECNDVVAAQLLDYYGNSARDRLADDPYILLAFFSFPVIDSFAHRRGIKAHDPRRLRGAVEAVLYEVEANARETISDTALRGGVATLLATETNDVDVAISHAVQGGSLFSGGDGVWIAEKMIRRINFIADKLVQLSKPTDMSQPNIWGLHGIAPEVRTILRRRLVRISGSVDTERDAFLLELISQASSNGVSVRIIAGSTQLSRHLSEELQYEVLDSSLNSRLNNVPTEAVSRLVVWVSSVQCTRAFARVLSTLSDFDQLAILDDGSHLAKKSSVTQLLTVCKVPFLSLRGTTISTSSVISEGLPSPNHFVPYNSRTPELNGEFFVRVSTELRERALIGLCYQQAARGSIALILPSKDAREAFATNWEQETLEIREQEPFDILIVAPTNEFEPGDVCTVIYVYSDNEHTAVDWPVLRNIARYRTIVVIHDDLVFNGQANDASSETAIVKLGRHYIQSQHLIT